VAFDEDDELPEDEEMLWTEESGWGRLPT
jgi:hypothetical protein